MLAFKDYNISKTLASEPDEKTKIDMVMMEVKSLFNECGINGRQNFILKPSDRWILLSERYSKRCILNKENTHIP